MIVIIDEEFNAEEFWGAIDWLSANDLSQPITVPPEYCKIIKELNEACRQGRITPLVEIYIDTICWEVMADPRIPNRSFWRAVEWLCEKDLSEPQEVPPDLRRVILQINEAGRQGRYTPLIETD